MRKESSIALAPIKFCLVYGFDHPLEIYPIHTILFSKFFITYMLEQVQKVLKHGFSGNSMQNQNIFSLKIFIHSIKHKQEPGVFAFHALV